MRSSVSINYTNLVYKSGDILDPHVLHTHFQATDLLSNIKEIIKH